MKESGAWFIRYASDTCEVTTEWWYVICDLYNQDELSSNTRSKINRGFRNCSIRRIDAEWLAKYGYECYFAAFDRYKNASSVKREIFCNNILKTTEGPFEYWGCFIRDNLAGYCQCILENIEVSTNVIKYHPAYLKYYTSYALITGIIDHYVTEKGMIVSNGTHSIAHDTNFQDFLLKLGFRPQFCRLNIVYQPWLRFTLQTLFPLRRFLARLPDHNLMHKLKALLLDDQVFLVDRDDVITVQIILLCRIFIFQRL